MKEPEGTYLTAERVKELFAYDVDYANVHPKEIWMLCNTLERAGNKDAVMFYQQMLDVLTQTFCNPGGEAHLELVETESSEIGIRFKLNLLTYIVGALEYIARKRDEAA